MFDRRASSKSPTLTHSPTIYGDAVSANLQVHIEALARRAFGGSSHLDTRLPHDDCTQAAMMEDNGMAFMSGAITMGSGVVPGMGLPRSDKQSSRSDSPGTEHRYPLLFFCYFVTSTYTCVCMCVSVCVCV